MYSSDKHTAALLLLLLLLLQPASIVARRSSGRGGSCLLRASPSQSALLCSVCAVLSSFLMRIKCSEAQESYCRGV
jgi:hypothetical protein